jgi:hypothetical protein
VADALGNLLGFTLAGCQESNTGRAERRVGEWPTGAVIGDKDRDADSYLAMLEARGTPATIPPPVQRSENVS